MSSSRSALVVCVASVAAGVLVVASEGTLAIALEGLSTTSPHLLCITGKMLVICLDPLGYFFGYVTPCAASAPNTVLALLLILLVLAGTAFCQVPPLLNPASYQTP